MATGGASRSKLLDAAQAEMLAKGYAATAVDEICARAGVSKGSFHHFFPAKEELGVDHLIDSAGKLWGGGCLMGTFALELAGTNPAIGNAVSAGFRAVAAIFPACARSSGNSDLHLVRAKWREMAAPAYRESPDRWVPCLCAQP